MSKRPISTIKLQLRVSNNQSCRPASSRKAESRPDDDDEILPRTKQMCEVSFDTRIDYAHALDGADEVTNNQNNSKQRSEKQDKNNDTATTSPGIIPNSKTAYRTGKIEEDEKGKGDHYDHELVIITHVK